VAGVVAGVVARVRVGVRVVGDTSLPLSLLSTEAAPSVSCVPLRTILFPETIGVQVLLSLLSLLSLLLLFLFLFLLLLFESTSSNSLGGEGEGSRFSLLLLRSTMKDVLFLFLLSPPSLKEATLLAVWVLLFESTTTNSSKWGALVSCGLRVLPPPLPLLPLVDLTVAS